MLKFRISVYPYLKAQRQKPAEPKELPGAYMRLREKTVYILFISLTVLLFILLISSLVITSGFEQIEERAAWERLNTQINIIATENAAFGATIADFAVSDSLYELMESRDAEQIALYFGDSVYKIHDIQYIILLDPEGGVAYGRGYDWKTGAGMEVPGALITSLAARPDIYQLHTSRNTIGLVNTTHGVFHIASHPILHSDESGPILGGLIMGRLIPPGTVVHLRSTLDPPPELYPYGFTDLSRDLIEAKERFSISELPFIQTINYTHTGGYAIVGDIEGNPVYIMRTEMPRYISGLGRETRNYFSLLAISSFAVFGILLMLMLNRSVLGRIARLNRQVLGIEIQKPAYARIVLDGNDELNDLSLSINDLLGKIEEYQEALRVSEHQYRTLVENLNIGVFRETGDSKGRFVQVNSAHARIFGYDSTAELLAVDPVLLYQNPEDRPAFLGELAGNGSVRNKVFRMQKKDGSPIWVAVTATAQCDDSGAILWVDGVAEDITERQQLEKALNESQEQLMFAVEATALGFADVNMHTGRANVNSRFAGMIVYSDEALALFGDFMATLRRLVHPDDLPGVVAKYSAYCDGLLPAFKDEYRLLCKDGQYRWILSHAKIVSIDENRCPARIIWTHQDITEMRQYREAIETSNKKLNLLNSITRHDILNQLTVALAYLELLDEMVPSDTQVRLYLHRIRDATTTIQKQISFTRDYQDMGVKEPKWQDISYLIQKASAMLPEKSVVLGKGVEELEIYADPLLEKVFYNLIDNGARHGGRITAITFSTSQSPDGSISLICEDDGLGIPADLKERIFARGYGRNTGYGLYLAREILSITGLSIRENGEPPNGARFEIRVPPGAYRFNVSSISDD